jgi:hypothetical protein
VERSRELTALLLSTLCSSWPSAEAEEQVSFVAAGDRALSVLQPSLLSTLRARVPRSGIVLLSSLAVQQQQQQQSLDSSSRAAVMEEEGGQGAAASAAAEEEQQDSSGSYSHLNPAGPFQSSRTDAAAAEAEADILQRLSRFYALTVDVVVVADDGSVEDAAVLAATAALQNTLLPLPAQQEQGCGSSGSSSGTARRRQRQQLQLRALPCCTTFAILCAEASPPNAGAGAGAGAGSAEAQPAAQLCVADPCIGNGEDLCAELLPIGAEGSGGGGAGASSAAGSGSSGAALTARGLAAAHFSLVCDARRAAPAPALAPAPAQEAAQQVQLLTVRKLGGAALPLEALQSSANIAQERASSLCAQLEAARAAAH